MSLNALVRLPLSSSSAGRTQLDDSLMGRYGRHHLHRHQQNHHQQKRRVGLVVEAKGKKSTSRQFQRQAPPPLPKIEDDGNPRFVIFIRTSNVISLSLFFLSCHSLFFSLISLLVLSVFLSLLSPGFSPLSLSYFFLLTSLSTFLSYFFLLTSLSTFSLVFLSPDFYLHFFTLLYFSALSLSSFFLLISLFFPSPISLSTFYLFFLSPEFSVQLSFFFLYLLSLSSDFSPSFLSPLYPVILSSFSLSSFSLLTSLFPFFLSSRSLFSHLPLIPVYI